MLQKTYTLTYISKDKEKQTYALFRVYYDSSSRPPDLITLELSSNPSKSFNLETENIKDLLSGSKNEIFSRDFVEFDNTLTNIREFRQIFRKIGINLPNFSPPTGYKYAKENNPPALDQTDYNYVG